MKINKADKVQQAVNQYLNKNDDGRHGKQAEVMVRFSIVERTMLDKVQALGKDDVIIYTKNNDGKREREVIEVKLGCGTVDYSDYTDAKIAGIPAQSFVDNAFPGVAWIVYLPEACDADVINDEAWVFSREEFINFLNGYTTKTGKPADMVKYNNKNGVTAINIQSFNSKPKERYLWNTLAGQPTLGEWKELNR